MVTRAPTLGTWLWAPIGLHQANLGRRVTLRAMALKTVRTTGPILALLGLTMLAACGRNDPKMTACVGDRPAVERTIDAAPPNCP